MRQFPEDRQGIRANKWRRCARPRRPIVGVPQSAANLVLGKSAANPMHLTRNPPPPLCDDSGKPRGRTFQRQPQAADQLAGVLVTAVGRRCGCPVPTLELAQACTMQVQHWQSIESATERAANAIGGSSAGGYADIKQLLDPVSAPPFLHEAGVASTGFWSAGRFLSSGTWVRQAQSC